MVEVTGEERVDSRFQNAKLIYVLAIAGTFAPLSIDFFAPSMPGATRDLAISAEAVQTTLYLFFIGYGIAPFLWGMLADKFGRRGTMLAGITVYILASIGCFLSSGILDLSALRLLQGIGAASGVVVGRAVLRDIYGAGGATRAISSMFMIMVWVPILAPLVGGYIAAELSWRVSFLVMAMVAAATLAGSYVWQPESAPERASTQVKNQDSWQRVLINPVFARYAQANMFCIGTLLLFVSNSSYIGAQYYQLSPHENGFVLAIFNGGISVGVYLVRWFAPRFGVEKTIHIGLGIALAGWLVLWAACLKGVPAPAVLLSPIVFACLGTGMVISLTVGQALIPFAYAAGAASALFICVQSAGSSLISFLVTRFLDSSLASLAAVLVACSLLAITGMQLIGKEEKV